MHRMGSFIKALGLVLLWVIPSTAAFGAVQTSLSASPDMSPRPRILVHYDMEGLAGQDDWRSAAIWWPEQFATGRRLLAADVNAVVAGLFDGGAGTVDAVDQHGSGHTGLNLPPELLDRRVRRHLHRHDAPKPEPGAYDAVVIVAMHAKTGSGGFMAHTGTFGIEWIINGRSVSEAEMAAYTWGEAGIPVILVSGDDVLRDDLLPQMPWIEYVVTKRSLSPQAVELRPVATVRSELRAGGKRAVERLRRMRPLRAATPVHAAVRAVPPADLSVLRDVPGVNFRDGQVSFVAQTLTEAVRGLWALRFIATELGGRPYVDEMMRKNPHRDATNRALETGFWELWMKLETERPSSSAAEPPQKRR